MSRNPGTILRLADGSLCILYNFQPLLKLHGKVVLHLLREDFTHQVSEITGSLRIMIRTIAEYNELIKTTKVIGKVD